MKFLETALIISCLPILGLGLFRCRIPRWLGLVLLALPAFLLIALMTTTEMRLHFIPAYFVPALLGAVAVVWLAIPNLYFPSSIVRAGAVLTLLLLAGGVFITRLIPVLEFPTPSGPYRVGVSDITLNNGDSRKLRVRLWYPAEKDAKGPSVPYLSSAKIPEKFFSSILLAQTNALKNVKVATIQSGCSVILYSPGWLGECYLNTTLFEALASEGFIVAAIELPTASENPAFLDFTTEEASQRFNEAAARELKSRMSDILRVFASLPDLQAGTLAQGRFKNTLNLSAVGAMGYSFGGAVTAEALLNEPTLRSGINFDGTLFGASAKGGTSQPFLFVIDNMTMPADSELHSDDPAARREAQFTALSINQMNQWLDTRGGYLVRVEGAQHSTFCDSPLYAYKGKLTGEDGQKALVMLKRINLSAIAFFNKTLRGQQAPLLEQNGFPWPGFEVRQFPSGKAKVPPES